LWNEQVEIVDFIFQLSGTYLQKIKQFFRVSYEELWKMINQHNKRMREKLQKKFSINSEYNFRDFMPSRGAFFDQIDRSYPENRKALASVGIKNNVKVKGLFIPDPNTKERKIKAMFYIESQAPGAKESYELFYDEIKRTKQPELVRWINGIKAPVKAYIAVKGAYNEIDTYLESQKAWMGDWHNAWSEYMQTDVCRLIIPLQSFASSTACDPKTQLEPFCTFVWQVHEGLLQFITQPQWKQAESWLKKVEKLEYFYQLLKICLEKMRYMYDHGCYIQEIVQRHNAAFK